MLVSGNKLKYALALLLILSVGAGVLVWAKWSAKTIAPLTLPVLSGERIHLPDQRGRLTWVNAWSSSCAACLHELPALETLHQEYGERVQMVAVAMPYDPPNTVMEVQDRLQLTLPLALDLDGQAARQFAPDLMVPSHHLLDPTGRVLLSVKGELTLAKMRAMLTPYLTR